MPAERIAMRQVRDVLRLKAAGVSGNEIARRVGVAPSTVRLTLKRLAAAGLRWPLPTEMTDATLEARLFTAVGKKQGHRRRAEPDWAAVHRELKRKHLTLQILWDEYIEQNPHGYCPSLCCHGYASGLCSPSRCARPMPAARSCSSTTPATRSRCFDGLTGEARPAQIFVAVLGASNYTYAEASWTEGLADWIGAHARAFGFIGGVPRCSSADNLKAGVTTACLYEPRVNRTYAEMAAHYGTAILPTRVRKPRDKAKVEVAVLIVERWILARLRHRRFFSLAELNAAIAELLAAQRPGRCAGSASAAASCSRTRPAGAQALCQPSPTPMPNGACAGSASTTTSRSTATSTGSPTAYARQRSRRGSTAAHRRGLPQGRARRRASARRRQPPAHHGARAHAERAIAAMPSGPSSGIRAGAAIGPATAQLIELILERRRIPSRASAPALGILRLVRPYGAERLEAACQRGLEIGARTYGSIASILKNGLDRQAASGPGGRRRAGRPRQHPRPPLLPLRRGHCSPIPPSIS